MARGFKLGGIPSFCMRRCNRTWFLLLSLGGGGGGAGGGGAGVGGG